MFYAYLAKIREIKGNKGLSQKEKIKKASLYTTQAQQQCFLKVEKDFLATTHIIELSKELIEKKKNHSIRIEV